MANCSNSADVKTNAATELISMPQTVSVVSLTASTSTYYYFICLYAKTLGNVELKRDLLFSKGCQYSNFTISTNIPSNPNLSKLFKTVNGIPIMFVVGNSSQTYDISDRIISDDPWNCPIVTWEITKVTSNSKSLLKAEW